VFIGSVGRVVGCAVVMLGIGTTTSLGQSTLPPPASDAGARPGNETGTGSSLPRSDRSSNIDRGDTRSTIAPNLPSPSIAPGSGPRDYLAAARNALLRGRTGEAQQALEMAETRVLDRSVPLGQTGVPSGNPVVAEIERALHALAAGDRGAAVQIIEAVMPQVQ
jgi:hypothetical protein